MAQPKTPLTYLLQLISLFPSVRHSVTATGADVLGHLWLPLLRHGFRGSDLEVLHVFVRQEERAKCELIEREPNAATLVLELKPVRMFLAHLTGLFVQKEVFLWVLSDRSSFVARPHTVQVSRLQCTVDEIS